MKEGRRGKAKIQRGSKCKGKVQKASSDLKASNGFLEFKTCKVGTRALDVAPVFRDRASSWAMPLEE